jgi:hypothetical protein
VDLLLSLLGFLGLLFLMGAALGHACEDVAYWRGRCREYEDRYGEALEELARLGQDTPPPDVPKE